MQHAKYVSLAEEILAYFECERCGECCRTLPISLSWADIERLYKMEGESFFDKLDDGAIENCLKTPCPYLRNNRCMIYDKRPLVCRVFPFEFAYPFPSIRLCPLGRKISAELGKLERELRSRNEDDTGKEAVRKVIEAYDRVGDMMYEEGQGMRCEVTIVSMELLEKLLNRLKGGE